MVFPNPKSIKRPDYLEPLTTREKRENWENDLTVRYKMLTEDFKVDGKKISSAYNKAMGGCNQKSIPTNDWHEIVNHCLWVSIYTYDRDKIQNIQKYNAAIEEWNRSNPDKKPKKLKRVPKTVCPLSNYFWKLIYFTSCTWYKRNAHLINSVSWDERVN